MAMQNRILDSHTVKYLMSAPMPQWFATKLDAEPYRDEARFRLGARCVDGDVTLFDFYFLLDSIEGRRMSNTRRALLQMVLEHITKEIATLELEKE